MPKKQPMRLLLFILISLLAVANAFCEAKKQKPPTPPAPSHLMVGPGIFDVDRDHLAALINIEYRWEVNCYHIRPLVAFFITTDQNFFVCGGVGYDIFFGKKVVFTPSFAPGLYCHGFGKHLGFPLNFRSAAELSYVFDNQGRFGAQFNHISNASILWKNPGANSLIFYYAIPFPPSKKKS
jgi:lipid A 3-O-deacylase